MKQILLVGIGGFIGSVLRYFVQGLNLNFQVLSIPLGTLLVNIAGSFIIGLLIGFSAKGDWLSYEMRLLLMVGFCGGFTTFSSFTAENFTLMQNGQFVPVLIYTGVSVITGFIAVYLGHVTSKLF